MTFLIFYYYFSEKIKTYYYFSEKIRLDILCNLFAMQTIHMKCQAIFLRKMQNKNVVCRSFISALRVKIFEFGVLTMTMIHFIVDKSLLVYLVFFNFLSSIIFKSNKVLKLFSRIKQTNTSQPLYNTIVGVHTINHDS